MPSSGCVHNGSFGQEVAKSVNEISPSMMDICSHLSFYEATLSNLVHHISEH